MVGGQGKMRCKHREIIAYQMALELYRMIVNLTGYLPSLHGWYKALGILCPNVSFLLCVLPW